MKYKFIFALLMVALSVGNVNAQNQGEDKRENLQRPPLNDGTQGEPRTPIILPQEIMCTYSSYFLGITLPNEIEYLSVVIEDENGMVLWTGVITHEQTSAMLPGITGEANISCTTETGVEYSGTLEFE